MPDRKIYVRKRTDKLSDHIHIKDDPWSVASRRKLIASMRHKMRRIFVGALKSIDNEKASGKIDTETHVKLRRQILDEGNNQIRAMEVELSERYNIESLNYHVTLIKSVEGR